MTFVLVNGDMERALRKLKRQTANEGLWRELKLRNFYEKPSEKRVREAKASIARRVKAERKKKARESGAGQTSHYRRPETRI